MEKVQNNNLIQAWLVLTLALLFGIALSGVQTVLGPKIEDNKIKETMEKVPVVILGVEKSRQLSEMGAGLKIEPRKISIQKGDRTKFYNVYGALFENGDRAGWVAKASGQGYADKIELLVGLDADAEKITGLFVLDQKETPGLGNKIVEETWQGQYIGKNIDNPLKVVKGGASGPYDIDAISGATISSVSVTGIVNQTISDLKDSLRAGNSENQKGKE